MFAADRRQRAARDHSEVQQHGRLQTGRSSVLPNGGAEQHAELLKFVKKLGSGSFGDVYLIVERLSGLQRCCKVIDKSNATLPVEQIRSEVRLLRTLDHPHIIKIIDVYEDYQNLYIIQDMCTGGELSRRVKSAAEKQKILTESYVKEIMQQALRAICYIHDRNIAHKDLKPDNILFADKDLHSSIKIIDFGLSERFNPSCPVSQNAAGTILFMAPELFHKQVTVKCDIWSLGCLMYYLLTNRHPFTGRTHAEIKNCIMRKEPSFSYYRHLSVRAVNLMTMMLTKNPARRPSARDLLGHSWFELSDSPLLFRLLAGEAVQRNQAREVVQPHAAERVAVPAKLCQPAL
uniref:Calcium-dependent protein kinase 3-like n=1 Tax=Dermatophagoides pteronyssinus TaxID=6956 RepID=A0A6P6XYQ9_DERPT|nr:calcium-dependent protein kinase 3-like [Dermatophagoides pteronyssinus]